MEQIKPESIGQLHQKLWELALHYGPHLLTALLILVVGVIVIRRIASAADSSLSKREIEPPLRMLMVRSLSAILFLCCLMMALENLGVALLPLLAGFGVAGVGVGLATQGVLSNLIAGLTIIFVHPYRIGEYISIAGVEGRVDQITLFSTFLAHSDRSVIVIPNRKIVGEILHNYGKSRQLELKVGVAYGTDLTEALRLVAEVLGRSKRVMQELTPVVGVSALGDSSIELSVKPWVLVPDYVPAGNEIYQGIISAFRAARIEVPFPQQELRLLGPVPVPVEVVANSQSTK